LINATVEGEMHGRLLTCFQSDGVRYEMDLLVAPTIRMAEQPTSTLGDQ
jgi:hypothetical protein